MCTLKKDEFFLCRRCKEEFTSILKSESEPTRIADEILTKYSLDIVVLVLAANILAKKSNYSTDNNLFKWAKHYENKIGFLMDLIKFNAFPKTIENVATIILNRFPDD